MNTVANETHARLFPFTVLHQFCFSALQSVGVPENDARVVADSLVEADAAGKSGHGVARLLPLYVRRLKAGTTRAVPKVSVVEESMATALLDGDAGLGQVVGQKAMRIAVAKALESGVGIVVARNSSHFGTGAFFLKQALQAQMIGIVLTNAPSVMPPAGGSKPFFGTNPLCIGVPGGSEPPVILDMSTSVVPRGKIAMKNFANQPIPEGWAIDEQGQSTRNAGAALQGALLPIGGYKGAGLAMFVDILCGLLSGAAFGPHIVDIYDEGDQVQALGHFFAALDIARFVPLVEFEERLDGMVREIRAQPRQPGVDRIRIPGERAFAQSQKSIQSGIPLDGVAVQQIDALAENLGIKTLTLRMEGFYEGQLRT